MTNVRIDYDDNGDLDDVSIENVRLFRLEYLDDNKIWLCCYLDDIEEPDVIIDLYSKKKIKSIITRDK